MSINSDGKIIYQSVGEAIKQYTQYCGYILKFLEKVEGEVNEAKASINLNKNA